MESTPPPKEPTLRFEATGSKWTGEDAFVDVVLTDQALQREVTAYMAKQRLSPDQRGDALRLLKTVKFWRTYQGPGGVDISIIYKLVGDAGARGHHAEQ